MCGIVGYIGTQAATEILLAGLEKLEYRGYDSAGIATVWEGDVNCVRAKGKLHNLRSKLEQLATPSQIGIGHTRWATHGKPEEYNAHPHLDTAMRIAVVQNGIIENYRELRDELKQKGHEFRSETDTEVIPHLIAEFLKNLPSPPLPTSSSPFLEAIRQAVKHLQGAFAIAVISADYPDELIVVRQQAPLVIGFGQGEFFCASDTPAIVSHTRAVLPLENGEIARLTPLGVEIYNFAGDRLKKQPRLLNLNPTMVEKQGFKHFMLKEIYEQPGVVRASLEAYFNPDTNTDESFTSPVNLGLSEEIYADLEQIHIVACGTSWHAALVGKYLLEQLAGISTQVHYASEYRYAPSPLTANTLIIGVTQSGETADTLAALAMEKERRQGKEAKYQARLLGITNRPESSLGHLVPHIINTLAGIEIGVAATKTFVAQLMAFYALALDLAYHRQTVAPDKLADIIQGLRQIPKEIEATLERQEKLTEHLAHEFAETKDFIFLGRGINFPIALEGALKLKEISYIHAEGYPAGEMKHGPIALLDAKVPVVAIAYPGSVYEKVISNSQEAKARDSRLIGVTPVNDGEAAEIFNDLLPVSSVDELLSPILTVVPLQLLAYHIAARRGLDVDQPRNLAKSVTVE
ncbi:glutamine--fructose-6-phosphate transaminase (isomerizing) [Anabaena sp. FACHB-709]|uniref:Glutamine--fructose-6-phosphate aminotransferase [isomerizing] n=2 Tax=Nostocaceae TaxID=1162 RepID=A0A1Z4KJE9_ANAVA|nr:MULTISPECIES: glutamine--fructose-6-phosphate transaminase (isomerizing) [Nostocaceae]BAY69092.1 D-fructose-6-phosphate amidotransferase [Trichormus variabilis NIES-23]HBW30316.1 glutamine--fructose-6-phosphate transaminase (isomerizing) [Nostoc sp. UBA8866]MBD2173878.1 glutamine--fructose-6-phosphate transaminase (isomerizing) [Anabaena cylindrica FACHB-318]MBD2265559.1 glutamine--fructose-6-phosphate transaminase (isomerizing) [Anabaena sp. FACHB-709]MBD2274918.1 glutamine--fructose-6-pho